MRNEVIIRQGDLLTGGASDNFYVVGEGYFQVRSSTAQQQPRQVSL